MNPTTDPVEAAAADLDYSAWTSNDTGDTIPQSTADTLIHEMARTLELQPGQRVLEIGAGTGYSGALLARIVGAQGHVVSLDVVDELVQRANARHAHANHHNIEVHVADGFAGWPAAAPYDRIVGWTTPHVIPTTWVEQAGDDAVLLTPVKVAPVALATLLVRAEVRQQQLVNQTFHRGRFIEMRPEVVTQFGLPIRDVDAHRRNELDRPPLWISAVALHSQDRAAAEAMLDLLGTAASHDGLAQEDREAFWTRLYTRAPDELVSVGTANGWGIGVAKTDGFAALVADRLIHAGNDAALPAAEHIARRLAPSRQTGPCHTCPGAHPRRVRLAGAGVTRYRGEINVRVDGSASGK